MVSLCIFLNCIYLLFFFYVIRLEPSSCLSVRAFADQYMCSSLVDAASIFIQKNFKAVVASQDFLALSDEEVLDLLSRDEINVTNEEQVQHNFLIFIRHANFPG